MAHHTDHELLAEFVKNGSETAFAALVAKYVNLVYSTALRHTNNSHHAEEITQGIPGAKLVTLAGCGHMSPMEKPEEVTRLLVDFFAG